MRKRRPSDRKSGGEGNERPDPIPDTPPAARPSTTSTATALVLLVVAVGAALALALLLSGRGLVGNQAAPLRAAATDATAGGDESPEAAPAAAHLSSSPRDPPTIPPPPTTTTATTATTTAATVPPATTPDADTDADTGADTDEDAEEIPAEFRTPEGQRMLQSLEQAREHVSARRLQAAADAQAEGVRLAQEHYSPPVVVDTMQTLARMYSRLHRHAEAASVYRKALDIQAQSTSSFPPQELVYTTTALAQELLRDLKLDDAQALLLQMMDRLELPPEARALLLQLESNILECKGDYVSALERYEKALKLTADKTVVHVARNLGLLRNLLAFEEIPDTVRPHIEARVAKFEEVLLQHGPWSDPWQLPANLLFGLRTQPIHHPDDYDDEVAQLLTVARSTIIDAFPALRQEYAALKERGLMARERECIHDVSRGHWSRFELNGLWQHLDADGCSRDAPVGCALYAELTQLGLRVLRAGYSAVEADTHIRPHFGVTNGQLKYHLGLIVPTAAGDALEAGAGGGGASGGGASGGEDGVPCATLRVANATHAWAEGEVLFFDDSFEHEVWNRCGSERVVFQVVFVHPDLAVPSDIRSDEAYAH